MIYIASPYTHPNPDIEGQRYEAVMAYTVWCLRKKLWCYSPIVHCHEMAHIHVLPTDAAFWMEYNFEMMRRCCALHVLKLEGWNKSVGIASEVAFWRVHKKGHNLRFIEPMDEHGDYRDEKVLRAGG